MTKRKWTVQSELRDGVIMEVTTFPGKATHEILDSLYKQKRFGILLTKFFKGLDTDVKKVAKFSTYLFNWEKAGIIVGKVSDDGLKVWFPGPKAFTKFGAGPKKQPEVQKESVLEIEGVNIPVKKLKPVYQALKEIFE